MDKLAFKKEVLVQARLRQQEIIDDFKRRISELRTSKALLNEDQYDHGQMSMDESNYIIIDELADELNMVNKEMDFLNRMEVGDHLHETVAPGSVVITDRKIFYPSVSVEDFEANGIDLYGISLKAPLYEMMKGKRSGEEFGFRGERYIITDLY